jgi:hypothetical protein
LIPAQPCRLRTYAQACALFVAVFAFCGLTHSQTVKEEIRLLDKPLGNSHGDPVTAGTTVKVTERQGFWVRVEVGGRSGWVKASGLSFSSGSGGSTAIDTGRLGTGNIVSTSAARGLSAKDLLNGTPRMDEVAKMAQYAPDNAAVQVFASQGRVVSLAQPVLLKAAEPPAAKPAAAQAEGKREGSSEPSKSTPKKGADDW